MAIDYTKRPNRPPDPPRPPDAGASPPAQPASGAGARPVSLSKVTLTKSAPSVSLTKQGATGGQLRVNLQWTSGATVKQGLFGKKTTGGIDLDLACMYEFTDGSKGVVQALGNAFQAPRRGAPIIVLDGDDRSGSNAAGENMTIDLSRVHEIRRVLVFTYIYEGSPNWSAANAVVTLFPASGPQIEVRLDESDPAAVSCAIALLENRGGDLVVNREVQYIRGAQDKVDQAYNWGMRWTAGSK